MLPLSARSSSSDCIDPDCLDDGSYGSGAVTLRSQPEVQPEIYPEDLALAMQSEDYSLLTDLYQLTMAVCYVGEGLDQRRASFELSVRRLPAGFGYLIAMGLAQALEYLDRLRFTAEQIARLQQLEVFRNVDDRFWARLAEFRFTGDVWAVPEGTAVFANEPLLRIEAPLWQAQLVETFLLNTLNYQTLIATRAARMRDAAGAEATLLEFGTRRAFSPQAALWAARAALAAGLNATSNVLAAMKLGRQPTGTMAHSLVMALTATEGSEDQAFTVFHRHFPGAPLLIDTYDTIAAAQRLSVQQQTGMDLAGVRIDSGDLVLLSQQIRALLPKVPIVASGDLDEYKIAELKAAGACIDGYGLGTQLVTGAPVNGVYKLVEIDGIPVMKEATGKVTYPGRKQIFRRYAPVFDCQYDRDQYDREQNEQGQVTGDRLGLHDEAAHADEISLMQCVMQQGQRILPPESLDTIADRTRRSIASLPLSARNLQTPIAPSLELSSHLQTLIQHTQKSHT